MDWVESTKKGVICQEKSITEIFQLPCKLLRGGTSNIDAIERVAPFFPDLVRIYAEQVKDLDDMYAHFPILKGKCLQKAGSLSGGEQQMLVIAHALMSDPKLLLMDEPSMGLSLIMVEEVGKIIRDINQSNKSIMLVE